MARKKTLIRQLIEKAIKETEVSAGPENTKFTLRTGVNKNPTKLGIKIQFEPSSGVEMDRDTKNVPVQSIEEREIQVSGCNHVDEVIIYEREVDIIEIIKTIDWDVRSLGDEY